jgi:acetyltransferase-like isoleucine patch superfamily enzyme
MKFKYLYFLYRILYLKIKYPISLSITSIQVSLEKQVYILIEGKGSIYFGRKLYIRKYSDIEARDGGILSIGDNVFINKNCTIISRNNIKIGDDCLFGENCSLYDHNHQFLNSNVQKHRFTSAKIIIGNRVWVGSSVFIGCGVTIGDDVVIGAHSIITKDIPSNSIVTNEHKLRIRPRKVIP